MISWTWSAVQWGLFCVLDFNFHSFVSLKMFVSFIFIVKTRVPPKPNFVQNNDKETLQWDSGGKWDQLLVPYNLPSVLRAAATTGSARPGTTSVSTSGGQVGHASCLVVTLRFLLIPFAASLAEREIQLGSD